MEGARGFKQKQRATCIEAGHAFPHVEIFKLFEVGAELLEHSLLIFQTGSFHRPGESYSAFRQKFLKLWTSVAHSFLHQIAQNKNWAHPKTSTLPRICKVEMEQASLLYHSAKPKPGGFWGRALRHCTSEPFDSRRFVEASERTERTVPCTVTLPS